MDVPLQPETEGQPRSIAVHCPVGQELKHHCNPDPWDTAWSAWRWLCHSQASHQSAWQASSDCPMGALWAQAGCGQCNSAKHLRSQVCLPTPSCSCVATTASGPCSFCLGRERNAQAVTVLLVTWSCDNLMCGALQATCLQPPLPGSVGWFELMVGWLSVLRSHMGLFHALPDLCLSAIDLFLAELLETWMFMWLQGWVCSPRLVAADTHTHTHTNVHTLVSPGACADLLPCQDLTARPLESLWYPAFPVAGSHTPYPTWTLPGLMFPREKHKNTHWFLQILALRHTGPLLHGFTPAAAHTHTHTCTQNMVPHSGKQLEMQFKKKIRAGPNKHNDQQPVHMQLALFIHLSLYFPCLLLHKQPSPSCPCLRSLPLKPHKFHTFPLTPLGHPAVNFTPFPKCPSHNESWTPEGNNPAQSARLSGDSSSCRLLWHPNHGQAVVCWGPWVYPGPGAAGIPLLVVISPSSHQLTAPTTVNVDGSQKSNPGVYTLVVDLKFDPQKSCDSWVFCALLIDFNFLSHYSFYSHTWKKVIS